MKNITLSLNERELEAGRRYALERGLSLNALIRQLLTRATAIKSEGWLDACFHDMDSIRVRKIKKITWSRADLCDV